MKATWDAVPKADDNTGVADASLEPKARRAPKKKVQRRKGSPNHGRFITGKRSGNIISDINPFVDLLPLFHNLEHLQNKISVLKIVKFYIWRFNMF